MPEQRKVVGYTLTPVYEGEVNHAPEGAYFVSRSLLKGVCGHAWEPLCNLFAGTGLDEMEWRDRGIRALQGLHGLMRFITPMKEATDA